MLESVTKCNRLKLIASDGKKYKTAESSTCRRSGNRYLCVHKKRIDDEQGNTKLKDAMTQAIEKELLKHEKGNTGKKGLKWPKKTL